jgi:LemA protein
MKPKFSMKWLGCGGLVLVVLIIVIIFWTSYNGLAGKDNKVDAQWANVENQYQRRFDLIPNLVEAVKGIFDQERAIFDNLAAARANYAGARNNDEKAAAATQTESALARLLVVVENYPQIASAQNVRALQDQLEGTENRISVERTRYNETVLSLNNAVRRFPSNIVAGMFSFEKRTYFNAAPGTEVAPRVNFGSTPTPVR